MLKKMFRNTLSANKSLLATALVLAAGQANAAPALFIDQSSSITGASDTLSLARVPVRNNAGAVNYFDIAIKFQVDAAGRPVLAPLNPVVSASPALLSAGFKAGNYKDAFGNVFRVSGPGATTAGRSNWAILWTKHGTNYPASWSFQGTWTTGPVAGHPIQPILTRQGITSNAFSWGTVQTNIGNFLNCAANEAIGYVQVGNQLVMHGFCANTTTETQQYQLSLCTATNPCP